MTERRTLQDWLMFAGLVVFWGSSFALTKLAVSGISPLWVMALRLVIAALFLYGWLRFKGDDLPFERRIWAWFAWLGVIGSILPFYLISWGSLHLASGLVGVTMALVPLVTLTLAHFMLRDEPMTAQKVLGFVIGFAGLMLLLAPQIPGSGSLDGLALLAQLAIMLAATSYALQNVMARLGPTVSPLQKATGVLITAAFGGLALALMFDPAGFSLTDLQALSATFILGIGPTALAALLLFGLLERTSAGFVAASNYLIPPFAYFLGVAALGEALEWHAVLGLLIILAGIYLAQRGP